MNRLPRDTRAAILSMLNEGMSIRSASRMTSVHKCTIQRLVVDAGKACGAEHARRVRDLQCRYVEADELWTFVEAKDKNLTTERRALPGVGTVYTFVALDPESKLIPTWLVGERNTATATQFLVDLGRRIPGTFQLSTDAANFYHDAAKTAFGTYVDFGMIWKHSVPKDESGSIPKHERTPFTVFGSPDPEHIRTSYVERHNLTMRMCMKRYTRRTNAFSKRVRNLRLAVATYMFVYNFARPHQTLTERAHGRPTTPAMAAGLESRPWQMADVVRLIEAREPTAVEVGQRRNDRRSN